MDDCFARFLTAKRHILMCVQSMEHSVDVEEKHGAFLCSTWRPSVWREVGIMKRVGKLEVDAYIPRIVAGRFLGQICCLSCMMYSGFYIRSTIPSTPK